MTTKTGISTGIPQVLIQGELGTLDGLYLFLPGVLAARPRRVGYFWYASSNNMSLVEFEWKQGPLSRFGIAFPRMSTFDTNKKYDTLVIEWNEPGLNWELYW